MAGHDFPSCLHRGIPESAHIYDSLPLIKNCFSTRLLTILPGDPSDPIKCNLRAVAVTAGTTYEALSYSWGDFTDLRTITVNSHSFETTASLEGALRALRRRDKKRVIWADAVCTNQNDLKERAGQVNEMGTVYQCAHRVLIWLGEGNQDTSAAFAWMSGSLPYGCWREPTVSDGLTNLLMRRWFTRVWVVQELARATCDPMIGCGQDWIQWSEFATAFKQSPIEALRPGRAKLNELCKIREEVRTPPRLRDQEAVGVLDDDLLPWIVRTSMFDATDPRDKVFALLGLSRNTFWKMLKINYSISNFELCDSLLRHNLKGPASLDVLVLCPPGWQSRTPSWLPDLSFPMPLWMYEACLASRKENRHRSQVNHWYTDLSPLGRGFECLRVAMWEKTNSSSSDDRCSIVGSTLNATGHLVGRVSKVVPDLDEYEGNVLSQDDPVGLEKHESVLDSRSLQYYSRQGESQADLVQKAFSRWFGVWSLLFERPEELKIWDEWLCRPRWDYLRIAQPLEGFCHFKTDTGFLGFGPSSIREGDEIVLLYASSFTFALRPQEEHYRLVGPVIVDAPCGDGTASLPDGSEKKYPALALVNHEVSRAILLRSTAGRSIEREWARMELSEWNSIRNDIAEGPDQARGGVLETMATRFNIE